MSDLFTDDFPNIDTAEELEQIKKQYPHYDDYYTVSGCLPDRRKKFNELWSVFEPYADSHFLDQYKYNFHARTWEMYLGNIFILNNIKIQSLDNGPDIKITSLKQLVWIEAVTCSKGEGPDAVPDVLLGHFTSVPHDEMLLRLTASLNAKFNQYKKYVKNKIINSNEPFIIAINRGSLEHVDTDMPLIFKCLFSIGYYSISIPVGGSHEEAKSGLLKREEVQKKSGGSVPLDFFQNKKFEGISGVIYSMQNILNAPDIIGSDCMLIHNPNAKNPLNKDDFTFINQRVVENGEIIKINKK